LRKRRFASVNYAVVLVSMLLSSWVLFSCGVETRTEVPIVSKLADDKLIGWDNASVSVDANIVTYAGKPFLTKSLRDSRAERAVEAYCKWKSGTAPYLPVKTAVGERLVEDWRAITLASGEVFIVGGAFKEPPGVIDQTWLLEPKTSRLKDGPQLLRARKSCTLSYLSSGKILVSGGLDGNAEPLSECENFDPKTQSMSKFSPLSCPRNGHSVIELGNKNLLVVNGRTNAKLADSPGRLTASLEEWKPGQNAFRIIGRTRKARFEPQLFLVSGDQVLIAKGHVFSGETETSESPPAETYFNDSTSRQRDLSQ